MIDSSGELEKECFMLKRYLVVTFKAKKGLVIFRYAIYSSHFPLFSWNELVCRQIFLFCLRLVCLYVVCITCVCLCWLWQPERNGSGYSRNYRLLSIELYLYMIDQIHHYTEELYFFSTEENNCFPASLEPKGVCVAGSTCTSSATVSQRSRCTYLSWCLSTLDLDHLHWGWTGEIESGASLEE